MNQARSIEHRNVLESKTNTIWTQYYGTILYYSVLNFSVLYYTIILYCIIRNSTLPSIILHYATLLYTTLYHTAVWWQSISFLASPCPLVWARVVGLCELDLFFHQHFYQVLKPRGCGVCWNPQCVKADELNKNAIPAATVGEWKPFVLAEVGVVEMGRSNGALKLSHCEAVMLQKAGKPSSWDLRTHCPFLTFLEFKGYDEGPIICMLCSSTPMGELTHYGCEDGRKTTHHPTLSTLSPQLPNPLQLTVFMHFLLGQC